MNTIHRFKKKAEVWFMASEGIASVALHRIEDKFPSLGRILDGEHGMDCFENSLKSLQRWVEIMGTS